jgi:hypothetical protein
MVRVYVWIFCACVCACSSSSSQPSDGPALENTSMPDAPEKAVFSQGPYGLNIRDTAGDFTLPTTQKEWVFKTQFNAQDVHVFVFFNKKIPLSNQLYNASVSDLLKISPPKVHYYFIAYQDIDTFVPWMQNILEKAIVDQETGQQTHWIKHTHVVTQTADTLTGWIGEHVRAQKPVVYAIAPDQTVREVGYLADITSSGQPSLKALAYTVEGLLQEHAAQTLLQTSKQQSLTVFDNTPMPPGWAASIETDITLPQQTFNHAWLELWMDCPQHADAQCPQWDHLAFLYLCDPNAPQQCNTETARWVSPYHREGHWITEVSPMLAHLKPGSTQHVKFVTHQPYLISLKWHFSYNATEPTPSEVFPMFTGGVFNQEYNPQHPPREFQVPQDAKKVVFYALLTGHGWGQDVANCAEFCNHQHVFKIHNQSFEFNHALAGTPQGCVQQISQGTVPNQYGTWPYGRAGWCPGMDVKPHIYDITHMVQKGAVNTLSYEALFKGKTYTPQAPTNPNSQGFAAEIQLTSYVVVYR